MKTLFSLITALIVVLGCSGCKVEPDASWQGNYLYEHSLGEGAGGITRVVEYELALTSEKGCQLTIVGFQISESIVCSIAVVDNALRIDFKSYENGETKNPIGVQVYPVGEPLFTLIEGEDGLETRWQNLKPDGLEAKTGIYFIKQ